jgi:urease accessory protein
VLGAARAVGGLLVVDTAWAEHGPPPAAVLGDTAVAMPLAGPAVLVTATGADALALRRALDAAHPALTREAGRACLDDEAISVASTAESHS